MEQTRPITMEYSIRVLSPRDTGGQWTLKLIYNGEAVEEHQFGGTPPRIERVEEWLRPIFQPYQGQILQRLIQGTDVILQEATRRH